MYNRWKKLRIEQLIHEDIRDVAKVQEVRQMDLLSEYIIAAAGSQISYSSLANNIRVSVDMWNDTGMGDFLLHYVRDKNQREVDFLVVKDSIPWFLVEVKSSESKQLSKSLVYFHELLQTKHAFQITFNAAFVERDCFKENRPVIVPWTTLLSQLV